MADALKTLRSLGSFRPGIAYVLDTLYLAPTSRSPAARTMRSCRGSDFAAPSSGLAPLPASRSSRSMATETGFVPLPEGAPEPTGKELAALVNEFCAATGAETVVFQGNGDPLAAVDVVLETVRLVAAERSGVKFRLNTLGLASPESIDSLFSSDAFGTASTRISTLSVFLAAADSETYDALLQPKQGGWEDVCAFVKRAAATGVEIECTGVDRPDVAINDVETLAMSLGATRFRKRSFLG